MIIANKRNYLAKLSDAINSVPIDSYLKATKLLSLFLFSICTILMLLYAGTISTNFGKVYSKSNLVLDTSKTMGKVMAYHTQVKRIDILVPHPYMPAFLKTRILTNVFSYIRN